MSKGGSWRSRTTSISDRSVRTGSPSVKWLPFVAHHHLTDAGEDLAVAQRSRSGVWWKPVAAPLRLNDSANVVSPQSKRWNVVTSGQRF